MPTVLPIEINNLINGKFINKTTQSNDFAGVLKNAEDKEKIKARLKEVSYEVEAIFINQLLKEMRTSVPKGSLFHGGSAENIFEDMLFDEYAKLMAKSDQFGLSRQIYDQVSKYL
ncbi:MAG: rod-binding protein [Nitrospirota bacterium]